MNKMILPHTLLCIVFILKQSWTCEIFIVSTLTFIRFLWQFMSRTVFLKLQNKAKKQKKGLWKGSRPVRPSVYRKQVKS